MEGRGLAAGKKNAQWLDAHIVFIDESGFLLIPSVRKTWAPCGRTPVIHHWYRHDRLSVISALSVSPKRRRLGLYSSFHQKNILGSDIAAFLRYLLRHLRGNVIVIWDNARIHRCQPVRDLCSRYHRLHLEALPPYAPELNPVEAAWGYTKGMLANGRPDDKNELLQDLVETVKEVSRSQRHLRGFIRKSDLPPFL
jgi:transposase